MYYISLHTDYRYDSQEFRLTFIRLTGVSKSFSFLIFRSWRYDEKVGSWLMSLFCVPNLPEVRKASIHFKLLANFILIHKIDLFWYSQHSWPQSCLFLQKWLHCRLLGSFWVGSAVSTEFWIVNSPGTRRNVLLIQKHSISQYLTYPPGGNKNIFNRDVYFWTTCLLMQKC